MIRQTAASVVATAFFVGMATSVKAAPHFVHKPTQLSTYEIARWGESGKPVSPQLARKLQVSLDNVVQETGIPGVAVGIVSPKGIWFGASGVSNLETKEPMQPDDIFAIASTSKTFTAATLLKLQEEGTLSLDDTLGKWLPEIAEKIPDGTSITIRQLLNGSGGIYNYTGSQQFVAEVAANPTKKWRPEEVLAYIDGKPRFQGEQCKPKWCYPNTGMYLASLVIEKATGSSFANVLRDRILNPLGLNHTFSGSDEQIVGRQAHGYQDILKADGSLGQDGIPDDLTDINLAAFRGNGAIFSNVQDQVKFSLALFRGKLLKKESLLEMLTFVDTGDGNYGLGIFPLETQWGKALGHGGDHPGYIAGRWYFPDSGITVVYLINRQYDMENREKDPKNAVFSAIMNPIVGESTSK